MRKLKEEFSLRKLAVALIAAAAIIHLVFNYVHTNALLLLENEICGFLMFMFILFGLVSLFQATRVKEGEALGQYVCALVCAVTDFFGYKLIEIYRYALGHQQSLDPAPVQKALWLSVAVMAAFAVAAVALVISGILGRKGAKHDR